MTETAETKRIVKDIKLYDPDAFVYKAHGSAYGKGGIPDLYVLTRGESWWLEIKVHPNKPTALQKQTMLDIVAAGGNVAIVTIEEIEPRKVWVMNIQFSTPGNTMYFTRNIRRRRGVHWPFGWLKTKELLADEFLQAQRLRPQP